MLAAIMLTPPSLYFVLVMYSLVQKIMFICVANFYWTPIALHTLGSSVLVTPLADTVLRTPWTIQLRAYLTFSLEITATGCIQMAHKGSVPPKPSCFLPCLCSWWEARFCTDLPGLSCNQELGVAVAVCIFTDNTAEDYAKSHSWLTE